MIVRVCVGIWDFSSIDLHIGESENFALCFNRNEEDN